MGWRYLMARIRVLNDRRSGRLDANPGSWKDETTRRNFADLDELRRKLRGG